MLIKLPEPKKNITRFSMPGCSPIYDHIQPPPSRVINMMIENNTHECKIQYSIILAPDQSSVWSKLKRQTEKRENENACLDLF
jgi:hypothetical protein